ncbi:exosortase H-associated membrane protein [Pseudazoarcus pumilus]|uniref:Uncharacterized protein n=1 Tax=Pseudazoarcus pumilus TaxID=2067960 RepID=A0A2I6S8W1_9RHOO|nr:exosortase H-associated membrane protein [Pseudazoarcus pumilus]AUN95699.1 hypothetical protein C0099_12620 [Pseudazoarcus pumilus]
MQRGLSVVGGFFLRTILALVPALAVWYWAREWVVQPVAWLVERVMLFFFPGWVYTTELQGTTQVLLTTIRVPQPGGMIAELAPEANVLTYCYGLPMLLALLIASRSRGLWWKFPLGALVILPFQTWGMVFDLLVKTGVQMHHLSAAVTGFSALQLNLFAVGYQLGFLLLPTLVPMLLWLAFERRFIGMVMFDAALDGATRSR